MKVWRGEKWEAGREQAKTRKDPRHLGLPGTKDQGKISGTSCEVGKGLSGGRLGNIKFLSFLGESKLRTTAVGHCAFEQRTELIQPLLEAVSILLGQKCSLSPYRKTQHKFSKLTLGMDDFLLKSKKINCLFFHRRRQLKTGRH